MKSTRVIGSIVLGLLIVLGVIMTLIATGVLDATPNTLILRSGSAEVMYNGQPLSCSDWEIAEGELKNGHTIKVQVTGSRVDAGTSENTMLVTILDENGADVTDSYDIKQIPGTLNVLGRSLDLMAENDTKNYDSEPLSCVSYRVLGGDLLEGHTLQVGMASERTEVGESENKFVVHVLTKDGVDVTHNYNIVCVTGELIVKPNPLIIQSHSNSKTYDGKPIDRPEPTIVEGALMEGHTINYVMTGTMTNAGTAKNTFAVEIKDAQGRNVTHNYTVTTAFGELKIDQKNVVLATGSARKDAYDGIPLTNNEWSYKNGTSVLEDHTINVVISGIITAPGECKNEVAEIWVTDSKGKDVSRNYKFTVIPGTLTVLGTKIGELPPEEEDEASGDEQDYSIGLPEDYDPNDQTLVLTAQSQLDTHVYFKSQSYGDYTGSGWAVATPYTGAPYSMDYIMSLAIEGLHGGQLNYMEIDLLGGKNYVLPYYMDREVLGHELQVSDTKYRIGKGNTRYDLLHYSYDYLANPNVRLHVPAELSLIEAAYYEYVQENYLGLTFDPEDITTEAALDFIIQEQGFDKSDPYVLAKVAKFIRGLAEYSYDYDRALDSEENIALAFLSGKYDKGICQHYATAATLLLRALGFPARYTVGYSADVVANEVISVMAKDAHAWVEVYIRGAGWIQLEVTAGMGSEPNTGGADFEDEKAPDDTPKIMELIVYPTHVEKLYDENSPTLLAKNEVSIFDFKTGKAVDLVALGYTYEVVVSGELSQVGKGKSKIESFIIKNQAGEDITDQFRLSKQDGRMQQYLTVITVTTKDYSKTYDGTPLIPDENGYTCTGMLLDGHSMKLTMKNMITNVSENGKNEFDVKITDRDGNDVTYIYKIEKVAGKLEILRREVTITADSKTIYITDIKDLTEPLTAPGYTCEGLIGDDYAVATVEGVLKDLGFEPNVVKPGVEIYTSAGARVTDNYKIIPVNGELNIWFDFSSM